MNDKVDSSIGLRSLEVVSLILWWFFWHTAIVFILPSYVPVGESPLMAELRTSDPNAVFPSVVALFIAVSAVSRRRWVVMSACTGYSTLVGVSAAFAAYNGQVVPAMLWGGFAVMGLMMAAFSSRVRT